MGLLLAFIVAGLQAGTIDLTPGRDPADPLQSAHVLVDESAGLGLEEVRKLPGRFVRNDSGFINPGTTSAVIWVRFDVRNSSDQAGEWILSLNRTLLDPGEIYLVSGDTVRTLLADSGEAYARSYAESGTLAGRFELAGHTEASLFVRYRGGNWSGLAPSLTTEATFRAGVVFDQFVLFALIGGVLSLVLYTVVSYLVLDRQAVFLYAVAQVSLLGFYVHFSGFTTAYLWPEQPEAGRIVAPLTMALSVAAILQFTRHFLATAIALPRVDAFMKVLLTTTVAAVAALPLDYVIEEFPRRLPLYAIYSVTLAAWTTVASVALHTALTRHRDFWPLAVSWCLMLVFMLILQLVWTGALDAVPLRRHLYGVFVYAEATFMALGVALRIRRLRARQVETEKRLSSSLAAELDATQRAVRLAEEREWALGDLAEKGRLILAAGHDTRQMISALRHYALGLKRNAGRERVAATGRALEQIATNLDEVLGTAIEGSASGGIGDRTVALELVTPVRITTPLRMIYAGMAAQKGIELSFRMSSTPLVTDRVLVGRIVSNLLSNALKYTDRGKVLVGCRAHGNGHRFQVYDTGRGMQPAELARLLDADTGAVRFQPGTEGHGAGFHIAKALAARLGGSIHAVSVLGRGSLFELRLTPVGQASATLDGRRLVLLDSADQLPEAFGDALALRGVRVSLATTADRAMTLIRDEGTAVLVDEHFGGTHQGIDLAKRISGDPAGPRVAVMTYDRSIEARMRIVEACSLIVCKPLSADLVLAALARLTDRLESQADSDSGGFHGARHA